MRKRKVLFGLALVAIFIVIVQQPVMAAQTSNATPPRAARWSKGYTADRLQNMNTMFVTVDKAIVGPDAKVCTGVHDSDPGFICKRGTKQADGKHVVQPGVYELPTEAQACGSTMQFNGLVIKRGDTIAELGPTLTYHRYCNTEAFRTATFQGKGAGVATVNRSCPAGTNRLRIWRLWPGPNGNITDPGVLTVLMGNGRVDHIGNQPSEVSQPFGKRYWEFYQVGDEQHGRSNRQVDMTMPSSTRIGILVASSDTDAPLRVTLAASDCLGKGQ